MAEDPSLDDPRFPAAALGSWLAAFCAIVALVTVWAMPLSLPVQIVATSVFALVPLTILVFWLGRLAEHRKRR